jgi:hypothetical protein
LFISYAETRSSGVYTDANYWTWLKLGLGLF